MALQEGTEYCPEFTAIAVMECFMGCLVSSSLLGFPCFLGGEGLGALPVVFQTSSAPTNTGLIKGELWGGYGHLCHGV